MGSLCWICYDRTYVRYLQANTVYLFSILRLDLLQNEDSFEQVFSQNTLTASGELSRLESKGDKLLAGKSIPNGQEISLAPGLAVRRIACFFAIFVFLMFMMNAMISSGLRRIKSSAFGATNQVMQGRVNAQIIITGSSRATAHYDPRKIEAITGHTAFNLGINGSQTDMQVAFLKAYLEHNQKPDVVIQNLDAFTFITTREVYNPVEYTPYLSDPELYHALHRINPDIWKSRYLPLYGYVVEDMKFTWVLGLKGFFGWSPPEDYYLGFNPRSKQWSDDFELFKKSNPDGVRFEIQVAGIQVVEDLIQVCRKNGIQLIFVYSPEYAEMQSLTKDRAEIFGKFHELADQYSIPLWDYSDWKYSANQDFFQNSQHLNATGAAVFSEDVGNKLKIYIESQSNTTGSSQISESANRLIVPE